VIRICCALFTGGECPQRHLQELWYLYTRSEGDKRDSNQGERSGGV